MCHVHVGIQVATTDIWVQMSEITSTSYNIIAAGSENMPWAPKDTSRDVEMILKSISNIYCHFNTNTMPGYSSCLYRYIFILHTI